MEQDSASVFLSNISVMILPEFHLGLTESLAEVLGHICAHKISLFGKIHIGYKLTHCTGHFFSFLASS